jgi:polyhydroxybutyrate depolymerase
MNLFHKTKNKMKIRIFICGAAAIACIVAITARHIEVVHAQDPVETLDVDGVTRSFTVHLPNGYDKAKKYPVVMMLHGFDEDGDDIERIAHFNQFADANGIVAVYPNALGRKWDLGVAPAQQNNGYPQRHRGFGGGGPGMGGPPYGGGGGGRHGGGQGRQRDEAVKANDLAYFDAMLDKVVSEYSTDVSRIYATGLGSGAVMDYRLACMMSERIAAIAPVGATFPESLAKNCGPSHPIAVLMIEGTADPINNYKGSGHPKPPAIPSLSAEDSAKTWSKLDTCSDKSKQSSIAAKTSGGMETKVEDFSDCQQGAEVELYSVVGGGNTWPGGEQYLSEKQIGKTSADFDADDVIWKFLAVRKLPAAAAAAPAQH